MSCNANVRYVVVLECQPEDVCKRISCNTGGDRAGRTDDDRAMIEKKLDIFRRRTAPLIRYYEDRGAVVCRIAASPTATPQDMYAEVLKGMGAHAEI